MGEKVPFTKCLLHEAKGAYISYMKFVGIVAGISILSAIILVAITTTNYDTMAQFIFMIPWWVDAICLIVMPPGIYSIIVCLGRQISRGDVEFAGIILFVIGVVCFIISGVILNIYLALFSAIVGIIGLLLMKSDR